MWIERGGVCREREGWVERGGWVIERGGWVREAVGG